jgi:hypothetical protein
VWKYCLSPLPITECNLLKKTRWQDELWQDYRKDLKTSTKRGKKKFVNTSDTKEGFCFVISVTGLKRPNTGRDDDINDKWTMQKDQLYQKTTAGGRVRNSKSLKLLPRHVTGKVNLNLMQYSRRWQYVSHSLRPHIPIGKEAKWASCDLEVTISSTAAETCTNVYIRTDLSTWILRWVSQYKSRRLPITVAA